MCVCVWGGNLKLLHRYQRTRETSLDGESFTGAICMFSQRGLKEGGEGRGHNTGHLLDKPPVQVGFIFWINPLSR